MKPNYRDYINSPEWKSRASYYKALAGHRCRVCNTDSETLDAHHRTYERLGSELDSDITVLCRSCHSLFESHKKRKDKPETPNLNDKIVRWFADIRKWKKFFYATIMTQSADVDIRGGAITVRFKPGHEVLANQVNLNGGELAHIFFAANGERVVVSGAVTEGV